VAAHAGAADRGRDCADGGSGVAAGHGRGGDAGATTGAGAGFRDVPVPPAASQLLAPLQEHAARHRTSPGGFAVSEEYYQTLRDKLDARTARVGVVGLGYVGLPLAVEFARAGFVTTGIDLDTRKIDAVNQGTSYIPDV